MAQGFWLLLIVAGLALTACSSSKSTNNGPSTNATTPAHPAVSPTTVPGATTACTIPQNNGGDHDADNNGGPDDGDGCDV
jgi:hypothetical protein